jgi:hypothetical protein
MKHLTRDQLIIAIVKRYGEDIHCRPSEDFDGQEGGVWMSGENGDPYEKDGLSVFDYYGEAKVYRYDTHGVHERFSKFLETRGWHCEWYDAGTIGIWS